MNREIRLAALAARQQGTFSREQAYGSGYTLWSVRSELKVGRWGQLQDNSFRLAGSPPTWDQAITGAWLAAGRGAVISGTAAARVHTLPVPTAFLELTVPLDRRVRLRGVLVRRCNLDGIDVQRVGCLRATTPTRTAIDLCATLPLDALVTLWDTLFSRRLSSPRFARKRLEQIGTRGRRGAAAARTMLERYPVERRPIDPDAEPELLTLLSVLPVEVVPQEPIRLASGKKIHVDAGIPSRRGCVELQSYVFHVDPEAFARDNERALELAAVGRIWIPVTPWDIRNRPSWVLDRVARACGLEP